MLHKCRTRTTKYLGNSTNRKVAKSSECGKFINNCLLPFCCGSLFKEDNTDVSIKVQTGINTVISWSVLWSDGRPLQLKYIKELEILMFKWVSEPEF